MSDYNTVIVNLLLGLYRNLDKNINEKIGYAGGNTGNIIFTEAMKEYLDYKSEIWLNARALGTIKNPSVIIPSANFIRVGEESLFEAIIRFLNQTDCPVTMAGLGAQAKTGTKPAELVKSISSVQVKALKMISERAKMIGVRGEFSAECLKLLGIHNVKIIGCPSFYFRESTSVSPVNLEHTQVTISPRSKNENLLLDKAMQWDSFWIMQMLTELPQLVQANDLSFKEQLLMQSTFSCSRLKADRIWQYMKEKSKIFFTYDEWKNIYKEEMIGFAYGSRFHGNMMALRNGVPALWITHDIRTEELVKTLHLPNIDFETFKKIDTLEELIEYCDYTECYKYSKTLHQQYVEFLNENGIKLKRSVPPPDGWPAWSQFEYFENRWEDRVELLSKYIENTDIKIMDLGCGEGKLINHLSVEKEYIPVDYKDRGNDNLICNFNNYEFPEIKVDVSFVSGVLEYIDDWKWFIASMCKYSNTVILSYCALDRYPEMSVRRRVHWVNDLFVKEIIAEFSKNEFIMAEELSFFEKTAIMKFKKYI